MPRYAIFACENLYNGEHGMNIATVQDCKNKSEAITLAIQYSMDVIHSYDGIIDILDEEVQDYICENMSEDAIENLRDDIYWEDINYYIFLIDEIKANNITTIELDKMYCDSPEEFEEKYCIIDV